MNPLIAPHTMASQMTFGPFDRGAGISSITVKCRLAHHINPTAAEILTVNRRIEGRQSISRLQ